MAASVENGQRTPAGARDRARLGAARDIRSARDGVPGIPGRGAQANVGGREVSVGGPRLLADLECRASCRARSSRRLAGRAKVERCCSSWPTERVLGALALEDEIRPESIEAVQPAASRWACRVAMITGDAQAAADSVARRIGIDEVAAQVLPRRQGRCGQALPGRRQARGNGGRRGQRCAGAGTGRRWDRHWRRNRRRASSRLASSWCATIRAMSSERSRYRAPATAR